MRFSHMAVRFMPFAHWNPDWGAAACGLGAACAGILALAGYGELALALLAGAGAACALLLAAGQMHFGPKEHLPEARLGEILNATPAAIAVTGRDGRVLWRSGAFAAITGGTGAGEDLSRLGDRQPETAAAVFRLFSAARKGEAREEAVTLPNRKAGELVRLKVTAFAGQGSRPQFLIWQIEERHTGPVLGDSRGGLLDRLPVPALIIAKDLTVEAANRSFEMLLGSSMLETEAWNLFRTRRGKPFTRSWLRDVLAKAEAPVSVQIPGPGGILRSVLLHCAMDRAGRCLCLAMPADAAVNLDDLFEALLARAPSPIALLSPKGVIQATNESFRELFMGDGKDLSSGTGLVGKSLALLVADASTQNVQDQIANLGAGTLAHRGPIDVQAVLKGPDGRRVHLVIFPAANGSNLIVQAIETGSPALSGEAAAQSQKLQAVGELAGGIAHDFNNLLTAIIGYSDLLLRRFRASDPAFKDVMNIKNSAARAAELVAQILAYSRRQTLRPAILKLTDVIEQFRATMGRTLGERVKMEVQHGRDLWFVKADEGQLFQVIMNLAVNARDAMPEGGEITIRTANVSERESLLLKERGLGRGEYVLCEVKDTGTGIKPEHLEKIFDPFFSTKEVGQGTGLGLSTVYGIVKQTGGTILVDSQMGVGTSFGIYLPRYAETEADLKSLESKTEAPAKNADLTGSGTVLLVEDEDAVRSFASRALSTRGYTVLEAANGAEALEIMDREHGQVDLVVSDVVMPGMDGPTLLRHLRERNPGIRIVFMSGYAEEAFRKNLGEDEHFIFLPKPFTLKKLAETVKAAAA
jgi:two-component system, cell cycle sensor histidine kinase and response regulator CckA